MNSKIMKLFGAQDMTVGNPTAVIMKFAVPLLIGNIAQQLYNTVDAVVVGKIIGDNALAAVGASNPILNLIIALFVGVATGAGIVVAQYFGSKNREALSKAVGNVIMLALVVSFIASILGLLISRPFLEFLDTPPELIDEAAKYLLIFMAGFVGCALYNLGAGILRGLGDSVMPLVFLLLACGLNIVLDLYFVAVVKWGVAGVAFATVIAQLISAILCMIRISRMKDVFDFKLKYFKPDRYLCTTIIKLGLPAGATQAIFSCAQLVVQSLTNSMGAAVISTSIAVMRVDGFAMMPNFTFGMAMTTYVGQNIGAGNIDRAKHSAKYGLRVSLITCVTLVAIILIFGRGLISVFTDTADIVDLGARALRILAAGYIGVAVTQVLGGIMRGAGDTFTPMLISIITTVVLRVPIAYGLAYLTRSEANPHGMPESLYVSLLVSWVCGAVITFIFYRFGRWKKKAHESIAAGKI